MFCMLIEMVLLSTHNIHFVLEIRKLILSSPEPLAHGELL